MPKVIDADAIFDATVRLFSERGFEATTMQLIAEQSGVNEVTLFRRFGSKVDLVARALTSRLSASPFAELAASGDVRADLRSIAEAYERTNRAYGGAVMSMLVEASRHPDLRPAIGGLLPNLRRAAEIVAFHQRQGALRAGDPLAMIVQLLSPFIAAGLWQRAGATGAAVAIDLDVVVDGFLWGWSPR